MTAKSGAFNAEKALSIEKSSGIEALQYLPVNLFGSVMGISGLALAWRLSAQLFGTSPIIGHSISALAIFMFVALVISYTIKLVRFPSQVSAEFQHPVIGNFFGTITIAVLLISSVVSAYNTDLSEALWIIGTVMTVAIAFIIVRRLLTRKQDLLNATPAWLIPGVGTLDVAVAGGTMPFEWAREINWFTFAIGALVALVLFTLIIARLMYHEPLPARMTPALMILIAPFEVGFLSYVNLTGEVDRFATVLFYFGLFLFLLLFRQVFKRGVPFTITWWALSFPIAALSNAALKYAIVVDVWPLKGIAAVILAVLTIVLAFILVRTLILLFTGKLLVKP